MTDQLVVKMALDSWNAQVQNASKLFNELSDEQLHSEVAPNRNRGTYLLGHLTAVNDKMLPLLGFGEQAYAHLNDPFLSKPDKTAADIPTAAELRSNWSASVASLAKHFDTLQPHEWLAKHTAVSEEDFAKEPHRNRLNVLMSRTGHLAYHLGQLKLIK